MPPADRRTADELFAVSKGLVDVELDQIALDRRRKKLQAERERLEPEAVRAEREAATKAVMDHLRRMGRTGAGGNQGTAQPAAAGVAPRIYSAAGYTVNLIDSSTHLEWDVRRGLLYCGSARPIRIRAKEGPLVAMLGAHQRDGWRLGEAVRWHTRKGKKDKTTIEKCKYLNDRIARAGGRAEFRPAGDGESTTVKLRAT